MTTMLHNPVQIEGCIKLSDKNDTTTALSGGATYTGDWELTHHSYVSVQCKADVAGTLFFEFAHGTSEPSSADSTFPVNGFAVAADTYEIQPAFKSSRWFRVRYVNGSAAQSSFFIYTQYSSQPIDLNQPLNQSMNSDNSANIIRVGNNYVTDVRRGFHTDQSIFTRWGYNGAVPNGSYADIWSYGASDPTYNWPATDETFRIKAGGNTADTAAGLGAQSVFFVYLDANGDEQTEEIATAGSSASSATSSTGRRFIRGYVGDTGTINSNNTGNIIIENSTSGLIVGYIEAAIGQTRMTHYTIPAGYRGYMLSLYVNVSVGTNKDADIRIWQRKSAYDVTTPFGAKLLVREFEGVQGELQRDLFNAQINFDPLTDIWIEGYGNGAVTSITAEYDLLLVKI